MHARLFLLIAPADKPHKGTYYVLNRIEPELPKVSVCWRLMKKDGGIYDVHVDQHGHQCTCADYIYRKGNTPYTCKHIQALLDLGIITGATPL